MSSSSNHNNPKIVNMLKYGNTYLTDFHKDFGLEGDLPLRIEKGIPPNPSVATFTAKQVAQMAKEQFDKVKKNAKRKGIIKDSEGKTIPLDETLPPTQQLFLDGLRDVIPPVVHNVFGSPGCIVSRRIQDVFCVDFECLDKDSFCFNSWGDMFSQPESGDGYCFKDVSVKVGKPLAVIQMEGVNMLGARNLQDIYDRNTKKVAGKLKAYLEEHKHLVEWNNIDIANCIGFYPILITLRTPAAVIDVVNTLIDDVIAMSDVVAMSEDACDEVSLTEEVQQAVSGTAMKSVLNAPVLLELIMSFIAMSHPIFVNNVLHFYRSATTNPLAKIVDKTYIELDKTMERDYREHLQLKVEQLHQDVHHRVEKYLKSKKYALVLVEHVLTYDDPVIIIIIEAYYRKDQNYYANKTYDDEHNFGLGEYFTKNKITDYGKKLWQDVEAYKCDFLASVMKKLFFSCKTNIPCFMDIATSLQPSIREKKVVNILKGYSYCIENIRDVITKDRLPYPVERYKLQTDKVFDPNFWLKKQNVCFYLVNNMVLPLTTYKTHVKPGEVSGAFFTRKTRQFDDLLKVVEVFKKLQAEGKISRLRHIDNSLGVWDAVIYDPKKHANLQKECIKYILLPKPKQEEIKHIKNDQGRSVLEPPDKEWDLKEKRSVLMTPPFSKFWEEYKKNKLY